MSNDPCGPGNCPIVTFADLTPAEQREQRARKAKEMFERGFTEQQIAKQFGVNQATISRDLADLCIVHKSKPAKTETNPKGAGRPKGKRSNPKPTEVAAKHERIIFLSDVGLKSNEIASEVGVTPRMVDRVLEVESARREGPHIPDVDPATLSLTAQQKLDAAIRQAKHKLEIEIETRCREDLRRWLNEVTLPQYAKELGALERSIRERKGIMDRVTYRKILACLHPDRVSDPALKKRYEEAFRLFTELEKRVLDEKESPTQFRKVPRTYEELMAMKAKVQAERRAKRAASKAPVSVR